MNQLTAPPAHSRPPEAVDPDTRRGEGVLGLATDIGLPLASFYTLHALGASDWAALLAASAAAGIRMVVVAVWTRRVSWFAAVMLGVFGVGLALAFTGGDPRVLLLKDSAPTAVIGAVFLASLLGQRPLTLAAAQAWRPRRAQALEQLYLTDPGARHAFRVSALGWGLGLVAEAALRVPLIYLLPLTAAVGASTALMIVSMLALAVWNAGYLGRAARRDPALVALLPPRATPGRRRDP